MNKSSLDAAIAGLKAQQAATAEAVAALKAEFSPANLAALGRQKAADAAKRATLKPTGKPKAWVLVSLSLAVALAVTAITLRVAWRTKP
jgi:peptidoglycan hydrolase CwlO-like protein